jgi:hypothetical protein
MRAQHSKIQKSKNPKLNQPLRQSCSHKGKVQILSSQATPQVQCEVEIELGELDFQMLALHSKIQKPQVQPTSNFFESGGGHRH